MSAILKGNSVTAAQISDATANSKLLLTTLGSGDGYVTMDGGSATLKAPGLTTSVDTNATPTLVTDGGLITGAS